MKTLKKEYEIGMSALGQKVKEFSWHDAEAYAHWLSQTYHYVKYSTRLLTLSATLVPLKNLPLHNRFIDHSKEERNHELLLVNDLKAIGRSIEDYPEHYPASGLYQSQFFWIQQNDPMTFFGYILFFEGVGSLHCGNMYKEVVKHHGEKAGVFLRVHHEDDQDHIIKAFAQIEKFSEQTKELVLQNFRQTTYLYNLLLDEAQRAAKGIKKSA